MSSEAAPTIRQVNAFLLDPARTAEELITIIGVAKGALDAASMQGKAQEAFDAATDDVLARERAKLAAG
jgi:hypothetical protein